METKPFSQACENNKHPILAVLKRVFSDSTEVLEIGSGTGQHAVFFAENLNHLQWTPSDRAENIAGIKTWLSEYQGSNMNEVKTFDIQDKHWPSSSADGVFSANTAHIMPWQLTQLMIKRVAAELPHNGVFTLYGPFNYKGQYTSESNANFDQWLKAHSEERGIRDFEQIVEIADQNKLALEEDNEMPANNRLLVFKKQRLKKQSR